MLLATTAQIKTLVPSLSSGIADEENSNVLIQSWGPPLPTTEDIGEHVPRLELVYSVPANTTDRVGQGRSARNLLLLTAVVEKSSITAPRFLKDELETVAIIKQPSAKKRRQGSKSTINDIFSKVQ